MEYVWFILNNSLLATISLLSCGILFREAGPAEKALAAYLLFPVWALLNILILGTLEILEPVYVTISLAVFSVLLFACLLRGKIALSETSRRRSLIMASIFMLFTLSAGMLAARYFTKGTNFGPDDMSYHSYFAARGVIARNLTPPFSVGQDFYPSNAETLSLWFLLPFHADGFVCLAGYYWGVLVLVLTVLYIRRFGGTPFAAFLGGAAVLLTPPVQQMIRSYAAVDLAAPCMFLASLLFLFPASRFSPHPASQSYGVSARRADLLMAGLCAGYCLGAKLSFLPFVALLWILAVVENRRQAPSALFRDGLLFMAAVLLVGGFWYFRNLFLTGNPFFPAEIGPFSGPLTREIQRRTTVFHWLFVQPFSPERWRTFFVSITNWPVSLFLLSAGGYLLTAVMLFKASGASVKRLKGALFLSGVLLFLLHFTMPFSGSSNAPTAPFRIELRFLLGPYLIGLLLLLSHVNLSRRWGQILTSLVCLAVLLRYGLRFEKIALAAGVILACAALGLLWKFRGHEIIFRVLSPLPLAAAVLGFWGGMAVFYPHNQHLTDRRILGKVQSPDPENDWAAVWRKLETLPSGSSVAGFGGVNPWYSYPYFGRQLQFRFVRINSDGTRREPMFERGSRQSGWFEWWSADSTVPARETLTTNLIDSGVDYLVLQTDQSGTWPPQRDLLQETPACTLVFQNPYAQIWKIAE